MKIAGGELQLKCSLGTTSKDRVGIYSRGSLHLGVYSRGLPIWQALAIEAFEDKYMYLCNPILQSISR